METGPGAHRCPREPDYTSTRPPLSQSVLYGVISTHDSPTLSGDGAFTRPKAVLEDGNACRQEPGAAEPPEGLSLWRVGERRAS